MAAVGEKKYNPTTYNFLKTVAKLVLYKFFPSKAHDDSRYAFSWMTLESL
jgi:hypothetical protein